MWRIINLFALYIAALSNAHAELTLQDAERLALSADPAVSASQSRANALREQSIADGQLPDPKLTFGVFNVPLDDLSMKKEGSSQLRTGVRQAFPRGKTLRYQQRRTEWLGRAEQARTQLTERQIRRDVRESFLELYYQLNASRIIEQNRALFSQLTEITRAHYASGRVSQQDVIQAQLELSRLDERATRISAQADVERAKLARWIGEAGWESIDPAFPDLPQPPSRESLLATLEQHPAVAVASAQVAADQQMVKAAREQYKPGFNVGLEYRKRFGNDNDGSDRPDMMAAMVSLDLPLFADKRQDRRLASSQQQTEAAIQIREQRLREVRRQLESDYARWQRLGEQEALYRDQLLQEASANTAAALSSYQNGINEFTTLMRARITELDVSLQDVRIRIDHARAQARLLYLAADGETQ
jgi:outer membrane protein TolC